MNYSVFVNIVCDNGWDTGNKCRIKTPVHICCIDCAMYFATIAYFDIILFFLCETVYVFHRYIPLFYFWIG